MVVILTIVATPLAAPPGAADEAAPRRDLLWRFIDDVLLGTSFPEEEEVITRWTRSPTVSLLSLAETRIKLRDGKLLESVIDEINVVLGNTGYELRYIGVDKQAPDIAVYILPQGNFVDFARILSAYDEEYPVDLENTFDFYFVSLNDDYSIAKVVAVISADVSRAKRRALMRYELLMALGFHNASAACPTSIFYRPDGLTVTIEQLAAVDRDVLRFLYSRLEPGDTWVPVWQAFQGLEPKHYGCSP